MNVLNVSEDSVESTDRLGGQAKGLQALGRQQVEAISTLPSVLVLEEVDVTGNVSCKLHDG